jgi:hypothetical protein
MPSGALPDADPPAGPADLERAGPGPARIAVRQRHLLVRPVVAEDEDSLTADVAMRIKDARELTAPGVLLTMPMVLLIGKALGWWNVASLVLGLGGGITLHMVRARSAPVGAAARQAVSAQ